MKINIIKGVDVVYVVYGLCRRVVVSIVFNEQNKVPKSQGTKYFYFPY